MLKRFLFRVIILLLVAISVFFIGWISLRVRPGVYAVYISKTSGVRDTVMKPGTFVWSLEALLPTNIKLVEFSMQAKTQTVELDGKLPSSDAYEAFMAGNPDFSWKLKATVTIRYNPDYLPWLYKNQGITNTSLLDEWLVTMAGAVMQKLQDKLFYAISNEIGTFMEGRLTDSLIKYLNDEFPMLVVENIMLQTLKLPDMAMYLLSRKLYLDYMERFQKAVEPAIASAAAKAVEEQIELEQLKKYGELFKEYPALIDYLAIKAGISTSKK